MVVNVIQLIRSALPDEVVRQLSNCLGLPPDATARVMGVSMPPLIAGLLNRCATLDGARALFATVLGQEVNADIAEHLPRIIASTTGVTQLSSTGRQLLEHSFERRIDGLSDAVSMQTGVPAHATHAITGIVGSILMGVLKRHLLDHQGNIGQLPALLGQQLPVIAPHLNDGLTTVLGLGAAGAFANAIGAQVRAVSSHFEPPAPAPAPAHMPAAPAAAAVARGPVEPVMSGGAAGAPAPAPVREVRHVGPAMKHWFGVAALSALLGAIAAMLTWMALGFCPAASSFFVHDAVGATPSASPAMATAPATALAAAQPAPDAAANAAANSAASASGKIDTNAARDSRLTVSVDENGKPTVAATVHDAAEKTALLGALTKKFGAGQFDADIAVDDGTKAADWLAHLDALMPLMSVPGAEMTIDGTHVELSGTAADTKAGWLDRLKGQLGAPYQVSAFDAAQAVANAAQSFRNAAKSLLAPGASCASAELVRTLNLQVVNFASRDAHVPSTAFDDLNQSAHMLKSCAAAGHALKLEVAGYSDNVGSEAANLELSKERAEAVRAFLVKAGVSADALIARGYGDARPVASNATESGRFANRRIEFSEARDQSQAQVQTQ